MVLNVKKFSGLADLNSFIAGKLRGSTDLVKNPGSLYLHGKTLIFATPVGTVTFAASPTAAQVPLTVAQVRAQIEAAVATVSCRFVQGRLELFLTAPGPLVLDKDGTANELLGFDTKTDSSVTPINPAGGASPTYVDLTPEGISGTYLLVFNV